MAPILVNRKGEHRELLAEVRKAGYVRLRINGEMKVTERSRPSTNAASTPSRR
jgi:excinuclease ABC subunit A